MATNIGRAVNVAVDSMWLYWANFVSSSQNAIVKMPIAGGTPLPLANVHLGGARVVVSAGNVYWVDGTNGPTDILKVGVDGGMTGTVTSSASPINRFAVGDDAVYWTSAGAVMKVGLDGGAPTMVAAGLSPAEIVVDATNVYWMDGSAIMKVGIAGGGTPVALAQPQSPMNLALDAGFIYWVDMSQALTRVRIDGSSPPELLHTSNSLIRAMAVDSSGIYWTDQSGTISVGFPGQTPFNPLALVSNATGFLNSIALDTASVYWIGGSSIYRTPK